MVMNRLLPPTTQITLYLIISQVQGLPMELKALPLRQAKIQRETILLPFNLIMVDSYQSEHGSE
jgi:hypothetical protein